MLYLIDLGNGEHLLLTEEKVLLNQYTDSSEVYDAFTNGMEAVAIAYDVLIKELSLTQEQCDVINEMYMELGVDDSTYPIVKYILDKVDLSP